MSGSTVPPHIPVSAIAQACGVSKFVARGWLRGAGIIKRISGQDVAGESAFRAHFPDAYLRVWSWYNEQAERAPASCSSVK